MSPVEFALLSAAVLGSAALVALLRPTWIVDHAWSVLGLLGLLTLVMAAAVVRIQPLGLRIGIDASSEPLLPANDPSEPVYERAIRDFGDDDIYVIAVESEDAFTRENLLLLEDLSRQIRHLPGVRRAQSLVDVNSYRWDPQKELLELGRFIPAVPSDPGELAELKRRALADPLYPKTVVSRDGKTAAINVTFDPMTDDDFEKLQLDERIEGILDGAEREGLRFHVTGRPHIRAKAHDLLIHDLLRLIPIAICVSIVALFFMTGSLRGTAVPTAANLTSAFWAYGAMGIVGSDLNLITLVMGPALITIGGVTCVHSFACYEEIAARHTSARDAALETLRYTAPVVMIAGLTTMVGFGALFVNDIPATNALGGYCVFGVAVITVMTLTALPAVLALLPLHADEGHALYRPQMRISEVFRSGIERLLAVTGRWQVRHAWPVLACWVVLLAIACSFIPSIVTDTDFITFFREDSDVRQDFAAVNRLLTGAAPIYVVLTSDNEATFREPEAARELERVQHRIEGLRGVTSVLSFVDLIKVARQAVEGGDPSAARIPDTRAELAELLFMIPKAELRTFATSNHSSANLLVRTDRVGSLAVHTLEDQIRAEIAAEKLPAGVRADVTGNTVRINRGADGIAGNQIAQLALTVGCVLLIVTLTFRSLGLGVLAMPTNLLPVGNFYGMLGAGVAPLSVPTSLIGSVALGITIDDTSHFLQAFRHKRAAGESAEEASLHCSVEVGRAMMTTSLMEITGFLVMLFSSFATLRQFGYLTAITMALCLASDIGMLPALLVALRRLSNPRRASESAAATAEPPASELAD